MPRLWPLPHAPLPQGTAPLAVVALVGDASSAILANQLVELPDAFRVPAERAAGRDEGADDCGCEVQMHVDRKHNVVYLCLSASLRGDALLSQAEEMLASRPGPVPGGEAIPPRLSAQTVHAWLSSYATDYHRALLLLFYVSHVLLFVSAARAPDLKILRTLRALHTLKQSLQPLVAKLAPQHGGSQSSRQPPPNPLSLPSVGFVFRAPEEASASAAAHQACNE